MAISKAPQPEIQYSVPGMVGTPHDPDLYRTAIAAKPIDGWDSLTDEHLDFYQQEGYLAIGSALSADEVDAAKSALLDLIMDRVPGFTNIMFEKSAAERLDTLTLDQRQDAVRKVMDFTRFDSRLRSVAEHPELLRVVGKLLRERPRMFQDMALIKPPHSGREKPWHQDKAYFNYPVSAKVVGVWIALDEATQENGCMHLQPQGHHTGPMLHFARRDWQICDTEIMGKPCVAAPLKPGGLLLFDGLLPHGTPTNHSKFRRKALQFHYIGESVQPVNVEERLAAFGSEGRDVQC